jgi:hypothetical protein
MSGTDSNRRNIKAQLKDVHMLNQNTTGSVNNRSGRLSNMSILEGYELIERSC